MQPQEEEKPEAVSTETHASDGVSIAETAKQAPPVLRGNREWRRKYAKAVARKHHVSFQAANAALHGKRPNSGQVKF